MTKKVAIIGAGYVGSSIAYILLIKSIAGEIVLIDKNADKCSAEINDLKYGIPKMGSSHIYSGTYKDIRDCDLIIITAGRNRRPSEDHMDLINDNLITARVITDEINKNYNGGIVIIVTNPVDVITYMMTGWLKLPAGRVFGTGCLLDSSRLVFTLADYFSIEPDKVSAFVIGQHGKEPTVLWSKVLVDGKGLSLDTGTKSKIESIISGMGMSIISGKGRTHYGIATCVGYLAETILHDRKATVSVTSVLNGEYGISDIAFSLPCLVSAAGFERLPEWTLSETESMQLKETAARLNQVVGQLCLPSLSAHQGEGC